jgi:hypothetical protein
MGHVRNEEVLLRVKEQRNILHEICKRKANWIGHILHRNCLLQGVIEGNIKGSGVPWNFFRGGSTNSVEDRERGSGGGSPLVGGSGGSCNLIQEISFHVVNFLNFWYFRLFIYLANLFVIVNVKQLRTEGVLEFYCLFPNILGCWCPKFSNF